ncbi:MAG: T9SS type A sorting domain-containing protein [Fibromonadaceae bacterium]|nr:T9SS type A sorting domain-containing protein [Fibromonadaceae bacterium]
MLKKATFCLALCLSSAFAQGTVNFPYPQQRAYGNNTINVTTANASQTLKSRFESFIATHYVTGTCNNRLNNVPCARITFDNAAETVSEGIAYGMIMMVYFSDNTTSYQNHFDRLWAYYQNWTNNNGLMNWRINGFSSVTGANAATDAEFDAAFALVMAHYQFGTGGNRNYLDTARALIQKIRQHEISTNNLHKPGDAWDSERNPSYVSPAAFEIFREVDTGFGSRWQDIITANYNLLIANQNATSGLWSDWCRDDGSHSRGNYGYDAARTPWRLAWANAWYGHSAARTMLQNLDNRFLSSRNANSIVGPMSLTGTGGNDRNSTFVGPFMNALSYSSSNQTKKNDFWGHLMGFTNEPYYSRALQVLTGLLATGNMPNLRALQAGGGSSSSSGLGGSSSSGSSNGVLIDKFAQAGSEPEEDRVFARTWEPWYAYTDVNNSGASTIQNPTTRDIAWDKETNSCREINGYTVIMQDGPDWVAKIDRYALSQGDNPYEPYVALGLDAENNGSTYNLSGCTGGFSYSYKGSAHNFKAQMRTVLDHAYHYMEVVPATTNWAEVTVPVSELRQPSGWGERVTFNLGLINAFSWELKGGLGVAAGLSATTGSLAIKDFRCIGNITFPSRPEPRCEGGVGSSSSGTVSSSSSSSGTNNSSSSAGNTPIALQQIVHNNALNAMQNAVNLQVTGNSTLQIFNLNGNLVHTQNFTQGSYLVPLANLPKGLYIVRASNASWKQIVTIPVK